MRMAIVVAHAGADCIGEALLSWGGYVPVLVEDGRNGILNAYQTGLHAAKLRDIELLAYLHDDLIIQEGYWYERVYDEFDDPQVGLVGFGGATEHCHPHLYEVPYHYSNLGRSNFLSNMEFAEAHGKRFEGSCDVAVLDGFSLIVRRELLEKAGGWPLNKLDYIGYDYWLCCMAHRLGYKIRMVGVACNHLGGRTYVKMGMVDRQDHWQKFLDAHEYIYNEFRDALPWPRR